MLKNEEIILTVTDVSVDGSGVGRYDNMAVFVPLTAVGDTVKVKILKVKKTYAFAKLLEILEKSPNRIEPDCPVFNKCGGCAYRHISYEAESDLKQNKVYEAVKRIGGIDLLPEPIIKAEKIDCYRNKAQLPFDLSGKAGFFAFHSHRVVPCNNCRLQPKVFSDIINAVEEYVRQNKITIYNEETNEGLLRHIYLRQAEKTGQIMLTLVINGDSLPNEKSFVAYITEKFDDQICSIQLNINKSKTNVILGDKCVLLYGEEYIKDILCEVSVRLSPLSFYQVNRDMAERLYKKVKEYANPENKNILDLYCGAGTIGLSMAKSANSLIGVEIIPKAIEDAKQNAKENGITNSRFICADAAKAAQMLLEEKLQPDVCIVDPPRKGCDSQLISIIANDFKPERVVYVSCDPATLARDLKLFDELGYKLKCYTPVDLFPRTAHVETVALLLRVI